MFSESCCTKGTQTSPEGQIPAHRQVEQRRNRAIWNLLLAALVHLGHIRRNGAVAEWLKAAVC
jgi:hypothetical protein